jgi:hypothetical protein
MATRIGRMPGRSWRWEHGTRWHKRAGARDVAQEIAEESPVLTRHADHDPALPCRPALGAGLCYPVPAGEWLA